ncbi:hypothetical protein PoB_005420500 [Plakobranchus ocellatus]|uniref:Uncharacterized protein n=1 Tax=Plakobranchus ocellatus TaxID=259542 RepID=A0AAV4C4U5_9GAST|nr:hypothetical protein PoB_005420500 [Plakobranchus ocellatus]
MERTTRVEVGTCKEREGSPLVTEAYTVEGERREVSDPHAKKIRMKSKKCQTEKKFWRRIHQSKHNKIVKRKTQGLLYMETSYCEKLGRKCHLAAKIGKRCFKNTTR